MLLLTRFYLLCHCSCFYYCFIARSFVVRHLLVLYVFNGRFSRRSRRLRRGMQQGCIISQTKDSYHIVECCLLFIQQICMRTRLLFFVRSLPFPYSFLVLSFLARSLLVPYVSLFFPYVLNGRSRVSRGNKIQKLRKFA